jgi:hypothetical protein
MRGCWQPERLRLALCDESDCMSTNLENASAMIVSWLASAAFEDGYIFGSLVHKDGSQFDPKMSDVDVVLRFRSPDSYLARWTALTSARDSVGDLNLQFLKLYRRTAADKPILSLVPTSSFELEHGLHKDGASQFYSHNDFYCVSTGVSGPIGNQHKHAKEHIEGALSSVKEAQRVRNKFFSIAPNGSQAMGTYDGPDVLPKELARCAAQVRWAYEKNRKADQRFDVNEGLVYALQLLVARRGEADAVDDLFQRVIVRMGGRGQPSPLTADDQCLLWEILADDARGLISEKTEARLIPVLRRRLQPHVNAQTRRQAFIRAGFKCSFPGCGVPFGEDGIGEIAFIANPNPNGPRYDPDLERTDAVGINNLVVLCPTHHRMIDASPSEYPVQLIKSWNERADPLPEHPVFNSKNLFTLARIISELIV